MPRKGLTKEVVIDTAFQMVAQEGYHAFSLHKLALQLGIKPASLYNHVEGLEELTDEIRFRSASMIRQAELDAVRDKTGDDAVFALCEAYRAFALENMELYKINMGLQMDRVEAAGFKKGEIIDPIFQVLSCYRLERSELMHWHRILRAMMHGFISQECEGRFRGFCADRNETFRLGIETVLLGIHASQSRQKACKE